jgi:disulfide bond formation protein DsbB
MRRQRLRTASAVCALVAAFALAIAFALEYWGGLVPCALCLWERWPYRIAIAAGVLALLLPALARPLLWLAFLTMVAGAGLAATHVGVESGWWPSPLPECVAPSLAGGSVADRLAHLPALPAKPCDEPVYVIEAIPVSLALLNFLFAVAFAVLLATFLLRRGRGWR